MEALLSAKQSSDARLWLDAGHMLDNLFKACGTSHVQASNCH